jgi:hypothetical protein
MRKRDGFCSGARLKSLWHFIKRTGFRVNGIRYAVKAQGKLRLCMTAVCAAVTFGTFVWRCSPPIFSRKTLCGAALRLHFVFNFQKCTNAVIVRVCAMCLLKFWGNLNIYQD